MDKGTVQQETYVDEKRISPSDTLNQHTTDIGTGVRLYALFKEMRPRQWTKNLAVFIGLVFSVRLLDPSAMTRTLVAFLAFCLASSSIYILNDLLDIEKDRQHPVKRKRPLASGALPVSWGIATMALLLMSCIGCVATMFVLPINTRLDVFAPYGGSSTVFAVVLAAYLLIMVAYSIRLKHVVLIDVFIIASGFVLRILAGTVAVPAYISPWLYIVTCFLSLFLALGKRRHELTLLQGHASQHRQILKEYSVPMLDQMITITVAGTIMSCSLYTIQSTGRNHQFLAVTIPLVVYGIFRYLYLVYMRMEGGSPEEVLLRDRHMLGTVMLCIILIMTVLYVLP